MAKLPEKNVLAGSKIPRTTTGEMKDALGKLRDYLNELLGEDSADKEAARLALGIDLVELTGRIDAKADYDSISAAVQSKADRSELTETAQELEEAIAKRGNPVGSIGYFAMVTPPAGYLKADGAAVRRETYPELFDAGSRKVLLRRGRRLKRGCRILRAMPVKYMVVLLPYVKERLSRTRAHGKAVLLEEALLQASPDFLSTHQHPIPSMAHPTPFSPLP